ncbi:MAG: hypothetical protein KBONHNOK_00454 [Candidatus Methanoperedenaceae archaeon GB50]|nr:MAG: hypothetical protein KBONHNOK_00454 [Candidatus Methanoperedenaceae archaeon GB50]
MKYRAQSMSALAESVGSCEKRLQDARIEVVEKREAKVGV